ESIDDETLQGNAAVRCRLPIERTLVNCADEERSGDPITFLDLLHDLETHVAERIIESLGGAAHDLQSKGRAVHRSGRREVILPARPVLLYEKRLQIEIDSCLVALDGIGRAACQ